MFGYARINVAAPLADGGCANPTYPCWSPTRRPEPPTCVIPAPLASEVLRAGPGRDPDSSQLALQARLSATLRRRFAEL